MNEQQINYEQCIKNACLKAGVKLNELCIADEVEDYYPIAKGSVKVAGKTWAFTLTCIHKNKNMYGLDLDRSISKEELRAADDYQEGDPVQEFFFEPTNEYPHRLDNYFSFYSKKLGKELHLKIDYDAFFSSDITALEKELVFVLKSLARIRTNVVICDTCGEWLYALKRK